MGFSPMLTVLALSLPCLTSGEYRRYHVDNADICNSGEFTKTTKTLDIGTGAAIFALSNPSRNLQPDYR